MHFLEEYEELFILCSSEDKNKIVDYISRSKKIYNVHFFTMDSIKKKLFFDYSKECIYEVACYLKVKPSIAKVYIENLYYIEDKKYGNKKLDSLVSLKKYLNDLGLLIYDEYFSSYIKNKNFIIYNFSFLSKFESKIIDQIKKYSHVSFFEEQNKTYKPVVYHASTLEEEVEFVCNKISDLLSTGVDIHKIKIVNINKDYEASLKRTFEFYHIPLNMPHSTFLLGTSIGQEFLKNYSSNISDTISSLKEKYNSDLMNQIISICNDYNFVTDYGLVKEFIIYDMKNCILSKPSFKDAIEIVSLSSVSEDDYVFLMNFNLNEIPKFKRDEDFITDSIKPLVQLDLIYEENKRIAAKVKKQILSIPNLIISYKDKSMTSSFFPSNLIHELSLEVKEATYEYKYSLLATKISLTKKLDQFIKFGHKDNKLSLLYNHISIPYQTYDNRFSGIKKEDFYDFINYDLKLSYSTLDNYNRCAFKYYLTHVLKLDIYEETFVTFIGSLFHYLLEKGLVNEINIAKEIEKFIHQKEKKLSIKEKFLLKKLEKEISFIISVIKEQMQHNHLKNFLFENKIEVKKEREISVVFKGFIDKICFQKVGNKTIVAIVDYKTGNASIDLRNSIYGIGMQLPIYLYLSKNYDKIENVVFAGFYLQKILGEENLIDDQKTVEEIKKEQLKLNGFSNCDPTILEWFDDTYIDSKVIQGMSVSHNGNFKTKKVLNNEQIDQLIDLTENVVNQMIDHILDADFAINPKQIGDTPKDRIGCAYCKFKDICFVNNRDFVKLKKQEDYSFLERKQE